MDIYEPDAPGIQLTLIAHLLTVPNPYQNINNMLLATVFKRQLSNLQPKSHISVLLTKVQTF